MLAVLAVTLPIYLIIALGFVVTRTGFVAAEDIRATGKVVLRVAMPAMIFLAISRTPLTEALRWDFLLGYLVASLLAFGAGVLLVRRGLGLPMRAAVLAGMGMSCSNSAFMGYPVASMVVGDAALQAFTMAMLVENILMVPLAVILADGAEADGRSALRRTLAGMVRNPLLLAVVAAVAFSLGGLTLPAPLERTLSMLAPVAPPIALLAIGGTVATLPFARADGPMLWVVAGKLLLHPLAAFVALSLMGGLPRDLLISGVLIAAVPMMSVYALFGQRWGQETLAASALILATVCSFATISAMLFLVGV